MAKHFKEESKDQKSPVPKALFIPTRIAMLGLLVYLCNPQADRGDRLMVAIIGLFFLTIAVFIGAWRTRKRMLELEKHVSPDYLTKLQLEEDVSKFAEELNILKKSLTDAKVEKDVADKNVRELKEEIENLTNEFYAQDHGLYEPKFIFANSSQYADALKKMPRPAEICCQS